MRDYLSMIQALLAKAERTDNENEKGAYWAKAHELMRKYSVDQEEALATGVGAEIKPIRSDLQVTFRRTEMREWYGQILSAITRHTGVRLAFNYPGGGLVGATIVGYEGDVRYTEFLWSAAQMMFSTKIDPVWDDSRTESENIFFLRNAGIERRKIADTAWGNGNTPAARNKVQRMYLKECAIRGEDARAAGLGHNTEVYREAYADAFYHTLNNRMRAARDAVDRISGAVELGGRTDRVNEAFYTIFPEYRPQPRSTDVEVVMTCDDCKKTRHSSGKCKHHRPRAWTMKDEAAYRRRTSSASAHAGQHAGQHAAEGVILRSNKPAPRRVDASGKAIEN